MWGGVCGGCCVGGVRISPAEIAQVAELVDALASGASDRKIVEVRVFSWAPNYFPQLRHVTLLLSFS